MCFQAWKLINVKVQCSLLFFWQRVMVSLATRCLQTPSTTNYVSQQPPNMHSTALTIDWSYLGLFLTFPCTLFKLFSCHSVLWNNVLVCQTAMLPIQLPVFSFRILSFWLEYTSLPLFWPFCCLIILDYVLDYPFSFDFWQLVCVYVFIF